MGDSDTPAPDAGRPARGPGRLGFIGLGQMGGPMAANIAARFPGLAVYDKAGSADLAPDGAEPVDSLDAVMERAETLFMSLPDGPVAVAVAGEIAAAKKNGAVARVRTVVDLSTIGIEAAQEADRVLGESGIVYVDAPVSGGRAGAIKGTVTVMLSGPADVIDALAPVLKAFAGNPFHVGERPGQGQALKLLNNYLSATAMAATSEAVLYGLSQGLEMKTILDAVNVSTGQNMASSDKFPKRIMTGTFDAGFATALLTKDARLFVESAERAGTPMAVAKTVIGVWEACNTALPGSDFTEIYKFLATDGGDGDGGG